MNILRIIIISILINSTLFSLTQVDSLKHLIKDSDPEQRVELLIELSKKLLERTQYSDALKYAENAIDICNEIENEKFKIQALSIISKSYLLSGNVSEAQVYCDSLLNLSNKTNYRYGLGLAYQTKGTLYSLSGDFESGLNYLDSSLQILTYTSFPLERAISFQTIATVNSFLGNSDTSHYYIQQAMDIFKEHNATYSYAILKLNKALLQGTTLGQYESAIDNAIATLPFFEREKDTAKISMAHSIIANGYDAIGNYEKAIKYYLEAISINKHRNPLYLANYYNNLGEVYKHKNNFIDAYSYYHKALVIFEKMSLKEGIVVAKNNIGECLINQEQYDKALQYFKESLAGVNKEMDFYKQTILYKNIGIVYLNKAEYNKAISYFEKSIKSGNQIKLLEEVYPVYKYLAEAYKEKGFYKEAYSNMINYSEGKDTFQKQSNAERLTNVEIKYQTEKKEKEIELLTQSQEIQNLHISNQQIITIALVILLILIGGIAILLLKRNKDKTRINLLLEEKTKRIENFAKELKLTNIQLTKSEENLTDLNATKDKFFSIIAHDLKGPFFSLLGLSELMSEETETMSRNELKSMSESINEAAKNVFALLVNLLEWAQTQLGMNKIEKQFFNFNDLADENLNIFKSNCKQKKIKLYSELIKDSQVYADRNMINFVLRNLISNAIKFTNRDGEIFLESRKEKNNFVVSIRDTGVGISEESLKKLFRIEHVFSTTGTNNEHGTGLGLILVKEFIDKNNGEIFVKSEVNTGTTFTFKLPLILSN